MILRFKQLYGEQNTLDLADHAAPFGRSHEGAIASDAIKLRENEVFVAGQDKPVRHLHGIRHGDWEMNGRFSDYWGGAGFARAMTSEVQRFVAQQQPCAITWGETLSAIGLITEFVPGRESEGETVWTMTVKIDSNEAVEQQFLVTKSERPSDHIARIQLFAAEIQAAFKGMPLRGSIFDAINSVISAFASVTAFAVSIANEISSIETEAIGSIRRFRAALGQLKTAALKVRDTVDAIPVDLAIESRHADDQFRFLKGQADISDSAISIILEAGNADRSAQAAERGRVLAIHEAKGGDTFESISSFYYGSAGRAKDIRAANSVTGARPPTAGSLYVIPV